MPRTRPHPHFTKHPKLIELADQLLSRPRRRVLSRADEAQVEEHYEKLINKQIPFTLSELGEVFNLSHSSTKRIINNYLTRKARHGNKI
jgi:hypothetical protein